MKNHSRYGLISILAAFILGWFLTTFLPTLCYAVDKSGVTPNTISLPTGPGSIEGLGESFQPTLNTGTAKYRVGLTVPPGTAGHAPNLALQYDGGGSNGPLGFGWSMGIAFVQRQTDKGIPRYVDTNNGIDDDGDGIVDEPDEIDIFINELKEELVLTADGYYFCENEGPFIRYRRQGAHWEANLPDGTLLEFGVTADARITDPATGHVYCWMLEKQIDTNGNTIVYKYTSFEDNENINQRYLSRIEYSPHAPPWDNFHFAAFEYETRPDWFEDCRSGFIVRTGERIREIAIGTQGPVLAGHASGDFNGDGQTDHLNRKYRLAYEAHSHWSLLTSVTWIGADNVSEYPPLTFGYTVSAPPETISASGEVIGSVNTPSFVMDNDLVDLVDLNGDALPDILKTDQFGGSHTAYLNQGQTDNNGTNAISWASAIEVSSDDGLAWNINLENGTSAIAHLADMDADGLADFVYKSAVGDVYFFRNEANVGWGPRLMMNVDPSGSAPPSPFGTENVKTADLDFDKRMDIIQSISTGGGADYRIWFNLGNQQFSRSVTVSQTFGFMLSDPGVHIADINGDRVSDVVRVRPTGLQVTAGLGFGSFAPMVNIRLPDYTFSSQQVEKARLQDISGDGLVDLVIERAAPGQLWYWINLGNYTLDSRRIIFGMPTPVGLNPAVRWADLNGNGSTDLVYADRYNDPRIQTVDIGRLIGCVPSPNILVSIDNGIGRKTNIEYTTSTKYLLEDVAESRDWPDPLPFPVNVISKLTVDDAMGHQYIWEYAYHNGYYDAEEKEFRGFKTTEQRNAGDLTTPDLIMVYTFDTGVIEEALKGKKIQVEAKNDQEEVFFREQYSWATRNLGDSTIGDGRKVTYPFLKQKINNVIEKGNGAPVQLKWDYEYDNFGNLIRQFEHGRMDEGWDDERITESSYSSGYPSGFSNWILRNVVEQIVEDEYGIKAAHKRNYYDNNLTLGEVSTGNLTRVEDWVSENKWVVSIRNEYDTYGNITAVYDPLYGVQTGHYRELVYDSIIHAFPVQEVIHTGKSNPAELTLSAAYDVGFGVVTSSTDYNGFTTAYEYDTFARITSIMKPPDIEPTVEYDYVLAHELGDGRIVNWVEIRQKDGSEGDGFLHTRTFSDGLGRAIMTRSEGETPGQIVVKDMVIYNARNKPWKEYLAYFETGTLDFSEPVLNTQFIEHFYDAMGREVRLNQPAGPEGIVHCATTYQPLSTTIRDEEQTRAGSIHFGCGKRYIEDGLQDKDGRGRLREVYEIVKLSDIGESLENPVEWKTTYSYDLLGNLIENSDSQGNKRFFHYDGLSRKTFMNHPERGHMYFTYDDFGNLVKTLDAKGQIIEYKYDGLNRLTAEYYGEGKIDPDVEYHYDLPFGLLRRGELWLTPWVDEIAEALLIGEFKAEYDLNGDSVLDVADVVMAAREQENQQTVTARNMLGYLSWVKDQSGEEHNSYDERGRVKWMIKRIINTIPADYRNFYTEMQYDSMDRVTKLTYPDRTNVTYEYNSRGLLEAVPGVIEQYDYNPPGQNAVLSLSCGVTTTYDYDHRLRLKSINTVRNSDGLELQSLTYTFDNVSNITSITDGRNNTQLDQIGAELGLNSGEARKYNETQSFVFDSQYRLTRASNASVYGTIDYRYDRIGNIVKKDATLLEPDPLMDLGAMVCGGSAGSWNRLGRNPGEPPGPHAVTATSKGPLGPLNFVYDDNGNMMTDGEKNLIWDYKDRLLELTNGKKTAEYLYDYTDTRKKKITTDSANSSEPTVVFYIDKFSEIRDGRLIKYVYAATNRIARSDTKPPTVYSLQPSAFYLHNHIGSTSVTVDASCALTEMTAYYPYGILRKKTLRSDASAAHYQFTGKERDQESGLHYFGARYYEPVIGRFISVDPLALQTEVKRHKPVQIRSYTYACNNPLAYIDRKGADDELVATLASTERGFTIKELNEFLQDKEGAWRKNFEVIFGGDIKEIRYQDENIFFSVKTDSGTKEVVIKGLVALSGVEYLGRASTKVTTSVLGAMGAWGGMGKAAAGYIKDTFGLVGQLVAGSAKSSAKKAVSSSVEQLGTKNLEKYKYDKKTGKLLRVGGSQQGFDTAVAGYKGVYEGTKKAIIEGVTEHETGQQLIEWGVEAVEAGVGYALE
jgi:RHS repeat-associated protein